jgi:prepilin signal peptidase PulO-like enzyme (type II secretory pathway)
MISFSTNTANRTLMPTDWIVSRKHCWYAALALPLVAGPIWWLVWQSQGAWLGTLAGFVLLAVLVTSAITDFRGHKIYNWATYSAFLWALAINVVASSLSSSENVLNQAYQRAVVGPEFLGAVGLSASLLGAVLCALVVLAGYHMSGGGAGDVKLAAAIGALLGFQHGIFAVAYSYIVAAVAIVAWSIYKNGPLTVAKAAVRTFGVLLGPIWPFSPSKSDGQLMMQPVPLGPYFAIGTLLVVLEVVPT